MPPHLKAVVFNGRECGGVRISQRLQHVALRDAGRQILHAQLLQPQQAELRGYRAADKGWCCVEGRGYRA